MLPEHEYDPYAPKTTPVTRDIVDRTGEKFGKFTVIGLAAQRTAKGKPRWVCRCECGCYEIRASRAITNPDNANDSCVACRQKTQRNTTREERRNIARENQIIHLTSTLLTIMYPGLHNSYIKRLRKLMTEKGIRIIEPDTLYAVTDNLLYSIFRHESQYEQVINHTANRQNSRALVQPVLEAKMREAKGER